MSVSTSKQPLEIILRFDTINTINVPKPKISRTRTGCFNCRKRKKKCDEGKPSCSTCESKCIPCVWPKQGERLPKEYKIPKADKLLLKAKKLERKFLSDTTTEAQVKFNEVKGFIPVEFEADTLKTLVLSNKRLIPIEQPKIVELMNEDDTESTEHDYEQSTELSSSQSSLELFECLDSELTVSPCSSTPEYVFPIFSRSDKHIMNSPNSLVDPFFTNVNEVLIIACANGFIKSINTQHTHPLLTTSATFTPLIKTNKLIEQVATSCGAAFLSWNNFEMKKSAIKKYHESFERLNDYLDSGDFDLERDEAWLGAAFQLLCVCAKVTWNCNIDNCVQNLNNSYRLVQLKIKYYDELYKSKKIKNRIELKEDEFLQDVSNDDLKMEIENNLIQKANGINQDGSEFSNNEPLYKGFFNNKFEKMFLDSFIYNYSIGILFVRDLKRLPNPFVIFKELRALLKTPLFSCDVAWMNNPVFGASLNSYELAAKASFIMRGDLNDIDNISQARILFDRAKYLTHPIIPIEVRVNSTTYQILRDSVLVSECVISATKILLMKILNPKIDEFDPLIAKEVSYIIAKIGQVGKTSQCKTVSSWALFICGLACTRSEDKKEIIKHLEIIGEITHAHYIYSVLEALEIAWGTNPNKELFPSVQGRGLEGLFDRDYLSTVVI